jgi:hypothetical protein
VPTRASTDAAVLVDALGVRIALDLSLVDDERAAAVRDAWADALAADQAGPHDAVVVVVRPGRGIPLMLSELTHDVTRTAVDRRKGEGWMLHAGAVASADGTVVVLVGPSGSGKTSATRALGHEFAYVSDETVFIDAGGVVSPYRKPLSLVDAGPRMPKREHAASALGLRGALPGALSVGAIVLLDRREGGPAQPVLEPVDLGDALPFLVAQSSHLPALPEALQTIARHAAAVGGIRRVTYRDAADLLDVVRALLDAPPVADVPPVVALPPAVDPVETTPAPTTPRERYTRAPADDVLELHDPDRLAILARGTVHVLAGIAPALWRAADDATLDRLTSRVVAEHGAPPAGDPADAVAAALAALAAAGLLLRTAPGWSIRWDVAWTDDGNEIIALALADWRSSAPLAMSGSSAAIWRALAGAPGAALERVIDALAADYAVPHAAIRQQVETFLDELRDADLVEEGYAPRGSRNARAAAGSDLSPRP